LTIAAGERPNYSERDVLQMMDTDASFRSLYGEIQRRLGRTLNTEELKILLGFVRYLGLSADVICVLVSYCQERARRRGSQRNPSLRTIEKEAYAWAEQGIDTLEEAAAFIQRQNVYNSRLSQLTRLLQIRGRNLTAAEERYAKSWLDMSFDDDVIAMAYERTCLNTGGLSWAYMNKILMRWHESGYRSVEDVKGGDRKPVPKGASGELGEAELEAIRRALQED
jgi:DnaD/phage-associated family protein